MILSDELLDAGTMPWLGRPDEVVEREVEPPPHVEELDGHPIAIRQRLFAESAAFRKTFCECSSLPITK